jgi:phage/plasmid-like protein (TIGR03299 family)
MAHLVTKTLNEKGDLALRNGAAWHGLGTVIDTMDRASGQMTLEEVLKLSGLDFEVKKSKLTYEIEGCNRQQFDDAYFTYRTDLGMVLGKHVGKTYEPLQNIHALRIMEELQNEGYSIESAGALDNGRIVFITSELDSFDVNASDSIKQYMVLSSSHDASSSIKAYLTNVRVVCNNTLNFSLSDASNMISIRHTATSQARLEDAAKVLFNANQLKEDATKVYTPMVTNNISRADLVSYIANVFLDENDLKAANKKEVTKVSTRKINIIDSILDYSLNGVGQDGLNGTVWGAYNAITGYCSNVKSFMNQNTRFQSLMSGSDARLMDRALVLASDFDKVATVSQDWIYSNN